MPYVHRHEIAITGSGMAIQIGLESRPCWTASSMWIALTAIVTNEPCPMPANIRPPLSVILAVLILVGCSGHPIAPTSGAISPTVSSYLSEMIAIMEANAIFRDRIDWNGLREKVFQKAKEWGAQNITEAYPAIQTALGLLGDHHSFYQPSIGQTVFNPAPRPCSVSGAPPPSVPPDIGFVQISGFGGTSAEG